MDWICVRCGKLSVTEVEPADRLCPTCAKAAAETDLSAYWSRLNAAKGKRRAVQDALKSQP